MNKYEGESEITLNEIDYPVKINCRVVSAFNTMRSCDLANIAVKSINAIHKTRDFNALDRAEIMTGAVSMTDAATLFYLAAKEKNSQVEFGEFQEAVILEGALETGTKKSYPFVFANLVESLVFGITDDAKKNS